MNNTRFKKGHTPWLKGTNIQTNTGKTHFKKGNHPKTEFKKGERKSVSTEFKKGGIPWNKGKKFSQFSRENHPLWIVDRSLFEYPDDWTEELKDSIRKRDSYICQECGLHQDELKGFNKKLDVHHIDYHKDNLNPENLITLCRGCHAKTNSNREYWINYFKQK